MIQQTISWAHRRAVARQRTWRKNLVGLRVEWLEARRLLSSLDFGDAPDPTAC